MKYTRGLAWVIWLASVGGATSAYAACSSNDDCKAGRQCQQGECVEPVAHCSRDRDCEGDDVCEGGVCATPPPRTRKLGDFAWQGEVFGAGQFAGTSPILGYGAMGAGGIWLGSKAALMAEVEFMLADGTYARQVLLGPALRLNHYGSVSGNFCVGMMFMRQPESTLNDNFYKALGLSITSWYELAGPFSFIYGAELAFPIGLDPNAVYNPGMTYGIVLGLGWVQQ